MILYPSGGTSLWAMWLVSVCFNHVSVIAQISTLLAKRCSWKLSILLQIDLVLIWEMQKSLVRSVIMFTGTRYVPPCLVWSLLLFHNPLLWIECIWWKSFWSALDLLYGVGLFLIPRAIAQALTPLSRWYKSKLLLLGLLKEGRNVVEYCCILFSKKSPLNY